MLEIGSLIAGPFAGRLLADMGAEVIKVESPQKLDPMRDWGRERYKGRYLWVNPGVILARVSGYGQSGPYSGRGGFASVAEAMGGLRYVNGFPDQPPTRTGISLGDSLGGMFAAQGILTALYWRGGPRKARQAGGHLTHQAR